MAIGRHIAKAISSAQRLDSKPCPKIQISSRNPNKLYENLKADKDIPNDHFSPAIPVDITKPSTLEAAFQDASVVISLVGIMHGSAQDFENIQWKGAENVAKVSKHVGAKLIHFSAIGADPESHIPYARTKGLAELAIMKIDQSSTIIRPSLVFGPEDDFFNVCTSVTPSKVVLTRFRSVLLDYPVSCHSCPFLVVVLPFFSLFMLEISPALSQNSP